jgi:predicted subunit of tRNA(5-methylaminomethyl-2-thiouridylate) methyltransferase
MFHPEIILHHSHIYTAPGNQNDAVQRQCQQHWIAEAIRYTHRKAVESLFAVEICANSSQMKPRVHLIDWPEFPTVNRLQTQKTVDYSLCPMLYNEGTIEGTYKVIENIFLEQLGDNSDTDFETRLQLNLTDGAYVCGHMEH